MDVQRMALEKLQLVLTIFIIVLFLLGGIVKVTPIVNADLHLQMVKNFKSYFTAWSKEEIGRESMMFLEKQGIHTTPDSFRHAVAVIELGSAALFILGPEFLRGIVNLFLIVVMAGAVYTHSLDGSEAGPAMVALVLLSVRFFLYLIPASKEAKKEKQH